MAPPVTSATEPTGYRIPEGYRAVFAFSKYPGVQLWCMTTRPAGLSAVEIITTTQWNDRFHTVRAGKLIRVKDISGQAAYDPDCMNDLINMTGDDLNSAVTIHLPRTGSSYSYWAWLKDIEFQELREGQFPMVNYTITISNYNTNNAQEEGPRVVLATGTGTGV